MAEDKNIKEKKPKVDGAAAPAKDAKQEITLPCLSVIVTIVLLKVAFT